MALLKPIAQQLPAADMHQQLPVDNLFYVENQRLKIALAERVEQVTQLRLEVQILMHETEVTTRENFEITEYMRKELLHKEDMNIRTRAALQEEQQHSAAELAAAKQLAAANEQQLQNDAALREEELGREIVDLKEQVAVVLEYKAKRQFVEDEFAALRQENERLKAELASQAKDLETKFLEKAARLKKGHEEQVEALKRTAELDAEERTDASIRRILTQNKNLTDELAMHVEVTEGLSKDLHELDADRRRLQRDLAIKSEVEQQMAMRGALQARTLKEGASHMAQLEGNLAAVLSGFKAERGNMKAATEQQLMESEGEQSSLRRLLKLKNHELANIRKLAQEVLSHRSDVEAFLLSSIHQVQKAAQNDHAIQTASHKDKQIVKSSSQIDIKDLSWDDRERVLRLLFMKINSQARNELPPHSLKPQQMDSSSERILPLHGALSGAARIALV
ncbi:hypothetical protein WJX84_004470 [Apatococcus fuscideae]|uniref:Cilia- and flagella-associated protein 157 n=1 Tax=Apatococcus fuscideae TaxID=2026836 RepID=A0AAW1T3L6_9CHLO